MPIALPPAAFVVGVSRSGTTLLRMMLDSHPQMAVPPESHFYFEMLKLTERGPATRESFHNFLTNFFSWSDFGITPSELKGALNEIEHFNFTEGVRAFYRLYAGRFGKKRWGEKTPDYGMIMPEIQTLLPEAHFIHIIRDGRDVALSRRSLWFGPGESIMAQAEDWTRWIMRARGVSGELPHYLEIRYEDLIAQPAEVLRKVCDFLQLPFAEEMLAYHETAGARLSALKGWPQLKLTGERLQSILTTTTKPPQINRVERWKREMTPEEGNLFREVAGPLLQELGYDIGRNGENVITASTSSRRTITEPSISALLLTDEISAEALPRFLRLRGKVDEFVTWIDTTRATAETEARVRQFATRIEYFRSTGFPEPFLERAIASCGTDWILRIDSDEELSPEWETAHWRDLLRMEQTNFALPRRWITPSGRYLVASPWWPDYQVRLFRNTPSKIRFSSKIHSVPEIEGGRGYCGSLALHHHVLCCRSRAEREAKVRFYRAQEDALDLGFYYLYEDHASPEEFLPAVATGTPESGLLHMGMMWPEEVEGVGLEILEVPEEIVPGALFWPQVRVNNCTSRALCSAPPFPVHLSYHWLEAASRQVVIFDGKRTQFFPFLAPQTENVYSVFVVAPPKPGDYLLQISLVQEEIRWFEDCARNFICEVPVRVDRAANVRAAAFA